MPATLVAAQDEKWVLVGTILPSSMAFISTTALNVVLPALQRDLQVTGTQLLWIVNAEILLLSSLLLVGGALGDRYGRKRVFMLGIGLFTLATIACGLAPSARFLIAARLVQGLGAALMVPGSLAILSASIADERRGRAIGIWSTFSTVTTAGGPILGGVLAEAGLWRMIFFLNVPLALVALLVLWRKVPESRDENAPPRLDVPGALLASLGLAGLTYGFIEAAERGFTDTRIIAAIGGGLLALLLFLLVEARSAHPMMPLQLFRSRTFSGANALTFFLYGALGAVLFFFPLNLIQVQGYPADLAAWALLPFSVLLALLSPVAGRWIDRIGPRLPLTLGPLISGLGFALLALPGLLNLEDDSLGTYISHYASSFLPGILCIGLGMGLTVAPLTTAVMGAAPRHSSGTASGINNAMARTASVLSVALLGSLMLVLFRGGLLERSASLGLSPAQQDALAAEAAKLAEARPPASLDASQAAALEGAIDWAFVDGFRVVAGIGAGMAFLSALLAFLIIQPLPGAEKAGRPESRPSDEHPPC